METQKHISISDVFAILGVCFVATLICNLITPCLYRSIKTDHSRTGLILNKLKDPEFNPDIIVFGSSKSMMGINCYQMSVELGQDAYNFSSIGQPAVESSLYYSMLPPSVKTVVQIIYPPINEETENDYKLRKTIAIPFFMGGYQLKPEIKEINPNTDLSELEKSRFIESFAARGSIIVPGLTYVLLPRDKEASDDLKFCNSYLTSRHAMYERTIEQGRKNSHMGGQDIIIDSVMTGTLEEYAKYLGSKGIKMAVVLMPSNPDVEEFSEGQMTLIGTRCQQSIPDALVLNYLSAIKDTQLFYDDAHLNKEGAKVITAMLDKDLSENNYF